MDDSSRTNSQQVIYVSSVISLPENEDVDLILQWATARVCDDIVKELDIYMVYTIFYLDSHHVSQCQRICHQPPLCLALANDDWLS